MDAESLRLLHGLSAIVIPEVGRRLGAGNDHDEDRRPARTSAHAAMHTATSHSQPTPGAASSSARLGFSADSDEQIGLSIDDSAASAPTTAASEAAAGSKAEKHAAAEAGQQQPLPSPSMRRSRQQREQDRERAKADAAAASRVHEVLRFLRMMRHTVQGIGTRSVLDLYSSMQRMHVRAGEVIFHAGQGSDDGMYIILKGRLGIYAAPQEQQSPPAENTARSPLIPVVLVPGRGASSVADSEPESTDAASSSSLGGIPTGAGAALPRRVTFENGHADVESTPVSEPAAGLAAGRSAPSAFRSPAAVLGQPLCTFLPAQTVGENALLAASYMRKQDCTNVDSSSSISAFSGGRRTGGAAADEIPRDAFRPVTAAAITDCTLLRLDRKLFMQFATLHPGALTSFVLTTTTRQWRVAYFCLVDFLRLGDAWNASLEPPGSAPAFLFDHDQGEETASGNTNGGAAGKAAKSGDGSAPRQQHVNGSGDRSPAGHASYPPPALVSHSAMRAAAASVLLKQPGELVYREGEEADSLFVILSGTAQTMMSRASRPPLDKEVSRCGTCGVVAGSGAPTDSGLTCSSGACSTSPPKNPGAAAPASNNQMLTTRIIGPGCVAGGHACFVGLAHLDSLVTLTQLQVAVFPRSAFTAMADQEVVLPHQQQQQQGGGVGVPAGARTPHLSVPSYIPFATSPFNEQDRATTLMEISLAVGRSLVPLLRMFLAHGLQRLWLRSGEVLFRSGDHQDGLYVIISGRLRTYLDPQSRNTGHHQQPHHGDGQHHHHHHHRHRSPAPSSGALSTGAPSTAGTSVASSVQAHDDSAAVSIPVAGDSNEEVIGDEGDDDGSGGDDSGSEGSPSMESGSTDGGSMQSGEQDDDGVSEDGDVGDSNGDAAAGARGRHIDAGVHPAMSFSAREYHLTRRRARKPTNSGGSNAGDSRSNIEGNGEDSPNPLNLNQVDDSSYNIGHDDHEGVEAAFDAKGNRMATWIDVDKDPGAAGRIGALKRKESAESAADLQAQGITPRDNNGTDTGRVGKRLNMEAASAGAVTATEARTQAADGVARKQQRSGRRRSHRHRHGGGVKADALDRAPSTSPVPFSSPTASQGPWGVADQLQSPAKRAESSSAAGTIDAIGGTEVNKQAHTVHATGSSASSGYPNVNVFAAGAAGLGHGRPASVIGTGTGAFGASGPLFAASQGHDGAGADSGDHAHRRHADGDAQHHHHQQHQHQHHQYVGGEGTIRMDAGRGETVGELSFLTCQPRRVSTAVCVRDCELVRISPAAFDLITARYPMVMMQFTRVVAQRYRDVVLRGANGGPAAQGPRLSIGPTRMPAPSPWQSSSMPAAAMAMAGQYGQQQWMDDRAQQGQAHMLYAIPSSLSRVGLQQQQQQHHPMSSANGAAAGGGDGSTFPIPGWPLDIPQASLTLHSPAAQRFVTIAVVPAGGNPIGISDFTARLVASLERANEGPVLHLTSAKLDSLVGAGTRTRLNQLFIRAKVGAWLSTQEERHRFIVFEADTDVLGDPTISRTPCEHHRRSMTASRYRPGQRLSSPLSRLGGDLRNNRTYADLAAEVMQSVREAGAGLEAGVRSIGRNLERTVKSKLGMDPREFLATALRAPGQRFAAAAYRTGLQPGSRFAAAAGTGGGTNARRSLHEIFDRSGHERAASGLPDDEEGDRYGYIPTAVEIERANAHAAALAWNKLCAQQADLCLLVGQAHSDPGLSHQEADVVYRAHVATAEQPTASARPRPRPSATGTAAAATSAAASSASQAMPMPHVHSLSHIPPASVLSSASDHLGIRPQPDVEASRQPATAQSKQSPIPPAVPDPQAQPAVSSRTSSRKELVLLHFDPTRRPQGTRAWLRARRVAWHHHLRTWNVRDYDRLARHICGKARGLVLGGGGSRGLAHLGAFAVLQERGIDIDVIGGTSQGAFAAGCYASTLDANECIPMANKLADSIGSKWNLLTSLTLPILSYFSGHSLNEMLIDIFGPTQIEDLWIRYFAITTNVTDACMAVHMTGPLWRYVRASMTIMGLLPPLLDKGRLLVDGGYCNNLPVEVMRSMAPQVGTAICVDVENKDNSIFEGIDDPGDSISGWYVAAKWIASLLRLGRPLRVPPLSEITLRVSYIAHSMMVRELMATADERIIYIRPDVGSRFALLEYNRMNEIVEAGRVATARVLDSWEDKQRRRMLREWRRRMRLEAAAAGGLRVNLQGGPRGVGAASVANL